MHLSKTIFRQLLFVVMLIASDLYAQDPNPPLITHVSVVEQNQQVEINWVNSSNQVVGYIIYFQDISGLWIPLDTIQGISNTTYLTTNANPQSKIETYSVVAFDAMGNNSIRSEAHSSMLLNYDYSNCDSAVFIFWNSYENMVGINSYQLKIQKRDIQNGTLLSVDSVSISLLDTSYFYPVDYSSRYTIWVEALSNSIYRSNSCQKNIYTTTVDLPTFCYVNRVSVLEENTIEISAVSNSSDIDYMNIYRSYTSNGFQFFVGKAQANQNDYQFKDPLVLPQINEYYYTARPVDICGREYNLPKFETISNTSESRNLQLIPLDINSNNFSLSIGSYDFFLEPSQLELWKIVNDTHFFQDYVNPNTSEEASTVEDYGKVCFYLKAIEQNINSFGLKDTVLSNEVCLSKVPLYHIPNSFSPNDDTKNDKWKVIVYKPNSVTSFKARIFNRWGQKIVDSNNLHMGWDGTYNNSLLPEGIYMYEVIINYSDNESVRETGSLMLLR